EGIAFEQLLALNAVEDATGSKVKELVTIGGGSKSRFWCQIIADITGKTICLPKNKEASALGVGICAAVGAGWYPTFKEAAQKMTGVIKTITPNYPMHEKYKGIFSEYEKIYPAINVIK
ncbi:MAG: FGGY-family carbohydrate kinase, partial [Calditrichaceae bacterium]